MFINNNLRDLSHRVALTHGFWDNYRTYEDFVHNIFDEFRETMDELMGDRKPTEVYFNNGNKPEGAPTELADIIIFILDYFGSSSPKINIDEGFLEETDKYYKNEKWYQLKRQKEPWQYFIEITDKCRDHIALSSYCNLVNGNGEVVLADGKVHSVPIELHHVIKLILEFCDVEGIDIEKNIVDKINYNNSRPKDYRSVGSKQLLETDYDKVMTEALNHGYGTYKIVPEIIDERKAINSEIERRRTQRKEIELQESKLSKKR